MSSNAKQILSSVLGAVCLAFAIGLTTKLFPVYAIGNADKLDFVIATRCWRNLQAGDLVVNEKGQMVGITEDESLDGKEIIHNIISTSPTTERVLFTTAEGVL
ncbi:hypothetical protein H8R94_01755 [Roseburia sp. NSJ-9]|uniref:Signal peptidase I n=1 Tax=Roseburia lenta TaxID=2763061 RepID=A0ABR7GEX5_9FIRM|nr:hypothetical protein [Roseburia lenta]MBC5685351.1 hypothetical protein [Roseburia lenta]MBD8914729.1 hypothetical protein [Pseudobutyrivibrio sp.]